MIAESLVSAILPSGVQAPVLYVATAEALDDEMERRVAEHRRRRPGGWETLEARRGIGAALRGSSFRDGAVLLDCLSLLVSNILLDFSAELEDDGELEGAVSAEVDRELDELLGWREEAGCGMVIVSNEVGWSVVPPHRLGRVYRDVLGRANQRVARKAHEVVAAIAGLPLVLKGNPSLFPQDGGGGATHAR